MKFKTLQKYLSGDKNIKDKKYVPKKSKVIPIPSTHYVTKAKRPRFSLLDSTLTKELLKIENDYWRYSLLEILQEIKLKNLFNVS